MIFCGTEERNGLLYQCPSPQRGTRPSFSKDSREGRQNPVAHSHYPPFAMTSLLAMANRIPWCLYPIVLGGLLFSLILGCGGSRQSQSRSPADSSVAPSPKASGTAIEETPDSLATLPRPLFYRDSLTQPVRARTDLDAVDTSSRAQVAVVGGAVDGRARWGLHIRAHLPDSSLLRPFPFVDLYGKRLVTRRQQAWRTVSSTGDSVIDARFVPISPSDLRDLGQADTVEIGINHARYRLPSTFRSTLNLLQHNTPDSLSPDTAGVTTLFTVYSEADTEPEPEDGYDAFVELLGDEVSPSQLTETSGSGSVAAEGTVRVIVHRDGSVSPLEVVRGGPPMFIKAVYRTLDGYTFTPARISGQPVPTLQTYTFTYEAERRPGSPPASPN